MQISKGGGGRHVRERKCWRVKGQGALWNEAPGPFLTFRTPSLPFLRLLSPQPLSFFPSLLLRENLDGFVLRAAKLLSLSMLLRVFVHTYSIRDPFVHRVQYVTWLDIISIACFLLLFFFFFTWRRINPSVDSFLSFHFFLPSPLLLLLLSRDCERRDGQKLIRDDVLYKQLFVFFELETIFQLEEFIMLKYYGNIGSFMGFQPARECSPNCCTKLRSDRKGLSRV